MATWLSPTHGYGCIALPVQGPSLVTHRELAAFPRLHSSLQGEPWSTALVPACDSLQPGLPEIPHGFSTDRV